MSDFGRAERVTSTVTALTSGLLAGANVRVGVDAVEVADLIEDMNLGGEEFLESIFARSERQHCKGDVEKLAARFAAKEAALKALGTGIRGLGLTDVWIDTTMEGYPTLRLSPQAENVAAGLGIEHLECSLTHEAGLALAVVLGVVRSAGNPNNAERKNNPNIAEREKP
jgi:holo-[acyl-carrier protein] synthase